MKGKVVVLPFPFSDLSKSKKHPALVVTNLGKDDAILCQITSQSRFDAYSIELNDVDFKEGGLKISSMVRPNKIFTADRSIISYKIGLLKDSKIREVEEKLVKNF